MRNVKSEVKGNTLTITVDLTQTLGPSKSGKTVMVGTSEGIQMVPGREERFGINVFRYEQKSSS
jgi:hypothetical protein